MAVECRLLVDDGGRQRHAADPAELADGRADLRQALHRHAEQPAQLLVPAAGREVHERGARGRGDVGDEAAGEPVEEPGIGGAQPQRRPAARPRPAARRAWRRKSRGRAAGRPARWSRAPHRSHAGARWPRRYGCPARRSPATAARRWPRPRRGSSRPDCRGPMAAAGPAASAQARTLASSSSGSCSTQPGRGCCWRWRTAWRISATPSSTISSRVLVVP